MSPTEMAVYGGQMYNAVHHELPYTGAELGLFVILAIMLIVSGFVLRRTGQ